MSEQIDIEFLDLTGTVEEFVQSLDTFFFEEILWRNMAT